MLSFALGDRYDPKQTCKHQQRVLVARRKFFRTTQRQTSRETVKLASPNLLARNRGMIKLENWMRKAKDGKSLNDFISQIKTLGLENDSKLRDFVSMWCVVDNEIALRGAESSMVKHIIHNFFLILY